MEHKKGSSNMLSSRQMARLLKKLSIREGDVLVVKESKFKEEDVLNLVKRAAEQLHLERIFVIMLSDFDDIEHLNRQDMNAHGWYHISQVNKLTGRKYIPGARSG